MSRPLFFSLLALVLAPFSAAAHETAVQRLDAELRVAVRQLSPENKLVLVGFVPDQLMKERAIKPEQHGFKPLDGSKDTGVMTPKYLFAANRHGIQKVYSFDLHNSSFQVEFLESGDTGAPPILVDMDSNRFRSAIHKVDGLAIRIVKAVFGIPIKGALYPFRQLVRLREYARQAQAAGLNYIFYEAMINCRFPSLVKPEGRCTGKVPGAQGVFSHEEIAAIGDALRFRYKLDIQQQLAHDALGGFGLRSEDLLYEQTLERKRDESLRMQSLLFSDLNRMGLYVQPISDSFGLILYDRTHLPGRAWQQERTEMRRPEDREKEYAEAGIERSEGTLVAIGKCTFSHGYPMICSVDFHDPDRQRNRALLFHVFQSAASVGSIVLGPIERFLGVGKDAVEYVIIKGGSTAHKREDRREACEELKNAIASGVKHFESLPNLDIEAAMHDVTRTRLFTPEQRAQFRARLVSEDSEVVAFAVRELLGHFANYSCGVKGISGGRGETNQVNLARERRWDALGGFLTLHSRAYDRELTDDARKTDEKIAARARKDEQRRLKKEAQDAAKREKEQREAANRPQPPLPPKAEPMPAGAKPVILFMLDGMRPDWLRDAVKRGIVPNIAKYFFAQGTELESFTSHSVTLTSWGTILTGVESDRHGLRASSNATRDPSVALDSFLDFRHDLKYLYYGANPESRGLMRLRSTKTRWLPDYVKPSEALTSFQPIRAQQFLPFVGFGKRAHVLAPLAAKGSLNGSKELDLATSADMAAAIDCNETARDCGVLFDLPPVTERLESETDSRHRAAAFSRPRSSYRLVTVWFSAVDHIGHEAPLELDVGLKAIDQGIGEIMTAASRHSTLKDAVAILTSDHGVSGGSVGDHGVPGAPHVDSEPLRPTDEIFNTTFNLAQFMAGDYTGAHEMPFVVGSHKIDKPFIAGKFDLLYKIMPPFSYTYAGSQKNTAPNTENVQGRSLLVEPYGDSLAHVIFTLDRARNMDPSKRKSFYELTRYPGRDGKAIDIPAKLLDYKVNNIVLTQNGIRDGVGTRLTAIHGNRPVGIFAMALEGEGALAWARSLAPAAPDDAKGEWRAPVLVRAHGGRSAVILTRDVGKEAYFRYVIVEGFGQISREAPGEPGKFSGTRTTDPAKDPLGYEVALPLGWHTDRQWAARLRDEWYPTAVFSIARNLTLASDYGMDPGTGKPLLYEGEQIIDERGKTFFSKIGSFLRLNELRPKVERVSKTVRSIAEAEQPDFILYSNIGFSFNPFQAHSGDHGGIAREHVKNSLFVYDPSATRKGEALRSIDPVLSKDVAATVLDYLGVLQHSVEGRSFRKLLTAPTR